MADLIPKGIQPCGLVISRVWYTGEINRNRQILCYELMDPDNGYVGVFHTPVTSRLAEKLMKYLVKESGS